MKQFNDVEELKQAFSDTQLPSIDVTDAVMSRINEISPKKRIFGRRKIFVPVLVGTLLLATFGFTSVYVFDLKGPGNNSYKYRVFNSADSFPPKLFENEFKQLEPGKALAIANTKGGENNYVEVREKPLIINSIDEISQKVGSAFKAPAILPDGYKFKESNIGYKLENIDYKGLMEKGEKSGEDYAYQVLNYTNEVSNYSIVYEKEDTIIYVTLQYNYPSDEISIGKSGLMGFKADKIKINSYDAVYLEHDGSADIQWLDKDGGKKTFYSIRSTMLRKETKGDLVKVAESLK